MVVLDYGDFVGLWVCGFENLWIVIMVILWVCGDLISSMHFLRADE